MLHYTDSASWKAIGSQVELQMIGGHDITFSTDTAEQTAVDTATLILDRWPQGIVEDAETGEVITRDTIGIRDIPPELLLYKSVAARKSCTANGAVEENANLMIHILRGDDSMTIVVDDPHTPEMAALLQDIRGQVYQKIS